MALTVITRPGQNNGAGDEKILFQTEFTNELIELMDRKTVTNGFVSHKKVRNAKAFSFKNTGDVGIGQDWDGTVLDGMGEMKTSETIINIEPRVYSVELLTEDDTAMNDFDQRSIIVKKMANKLSNRKDVDRINEMIKASRAPNKITGLPGGTEIVNLDLSNADTKLKGEAVYDSLVAATQALFEKDKGEDDLVCFLAPPEYTAVRKLDKLISSDYTSVNGGYDKGNVLMINNIPIIQTNNLKRVDSTNIVDTVNYSEFHGVTAQNVYGVIVAMDTVASGELIADAVRFVEIEDAFSTKIIASYIAGHGILDVTGAVTIVDVATV